MVGNPLFSRPARLAQATAAPPAGAERRSLLPDGRPHAPLPSTAVEAEKIARLYGAVPLIGPAATEAAVRRQIEQADIVHLATHGCLDSRWAMSSRVLLAAPKREAAEEDTADDGVL